MLLSDAAKTGRKFRRKSEPDTWYFLQGKRVCVRYPDGKGTDDFMLDAEMIVANDWETEPQKLEITAKDLMDVAKNLSTHPITSQRRLAPVEFMKLVIEELGLSDG